MKPHVLLTSAVMLVVSYMFSAVIGGSLGYDPQTAGYVLPSVGLTLNILGVLPQGALFAVPDITAVNTALNAYINVNKSKIWTDVKNGLELSQYCTRIRGVHGEHAEMTARVGEVLQAFQKAWTPKATVSFEPLISRSFHIKADFPLDDLDVIWGSFIDFMGDPNIQRKDWDISKFIVTQLMVPQMYNDLNAASADAVFVAPTPGTAGATSAMMNGLLTVTENHITAGDFTPITTGTIDNTNAVENLEDFVKQIDPKYRPNNRKTTILTGDDVVNAYKENLQNQYSVPLPNNVSNSVMLRNRNIELVGISSFGASQKLIHCPKENILEFMDGSPENLETQVDKRVINVLTDFWFGYGYASAVGVSVNEQA